MKPSCSCLLFTMAASLSCATVDAAMPEFELDGYFALTGTWVSRDDPFYLYAAAGDQAEPADGRTFDLAPASKLGLMATVTFSSSWRASIQAVAQRWSPREPVILVNQAWLDWHPNRDWSIKFGRNPLGLFMYEDTSYVDYAQLWVKAPLEVYARVPKKYADGILITHYREWADWYWQFQIAAGAADYYSQQFRRDVNQIYGASINASRGNLTAHFGMRTFDVTLKEAPSLQDALDFISAVGTAEGQQGVVDGYTSTLALPGFAFGMSYQGPAWTLTGEVATYLPDMDYMPDKIFEGYLLAGYRIGQWTPYALFGFIDEKGRGPETRLSGADPSSQIAIATANYLKEAIRADQHTGAIGLRYDVADGLALKLQWDRVWRPAGIQGWFIAPENEANFAPATSNHTDVVSLSLQGVF